MELTERVRRERELRGLSVRKAAEMGGVSNETWGKFERQLTPLSPKIRTAIASVFGWPMDWPERPPRPSRAGTAMLDPISQLRSEVEELAQQVRTQATVIDRLQGVVEQLQRGRDGGVSSP